MSKNQRILCWLGIFPVPATLVILGAQSAYWFGSIAGAWPPAVFLLVVGILLGVFSLSRIQFCSSTIKRISVTLYIPVLAILLWVIAFLTACSNGDCI
jgi:protein-S-isoprenylcysteine O-methyltransferase Ste14